MANTGIRGRDYKSYETLANATNRALLPYLNEVDIPQAGDSESKKVGREALFNRFYAYYYSGNLGDASGSQSVNYFEDDKGWAPKEIERNPTASKIIEWSKGKNAAEYSWEDFLWGKNYGKVPNNYMITLRRFGAPVGDNLLNNERQGTPDIGRMVGWIDGEKNKIEDLMKFSVKFNWEEFKSEIQTLQGGGYGGSGGGSMIGKILGATDTKGSNTARSKGSSGDVDPYANGMNKILGPINVIDKMMVRKRGLNFEQSIKLTFEYELKSIDGINGKIAFLDLVMNVMMVTYNRGDFWGGARRYVGGSRQSNPLAGQDGMKMLKNGDFGGFLGKLTDGLSSRLNDLTGGKGLSLEGIGNALKSVGGNIASRAAGGSMDKMGRPQAQAMMALLTGEDTGEWHVQLGNPSRPMLSVGNLILENTELKFEGPLNKDDFPTKLTVVCSLKPARPRDRDDIQMMFAPGNGERLYGSALDFIKKSYYGQVNAGGVSNAEGDQSSSQNPTGVMNTMDTNALNAEEQQVQNILAQRFPNHANDAGIVENISKFTT